MGDDSDDDNGFEPIEPYEPDEIYPFKAWWSVYSLAMTWNASSQVGKT